MYLVIDMPLFIRKLVVIDLLKLHVCGRHCSVIQYYHHYHPNGLPLLPRKQLNRLLRVAHWQLICWSPKDEFLLRLKLTVEKE